MSTRALKERSASISTCSRIEQSCREERTAQRVGRTYDANLSNKLSTGFVNENYQYPCTCGMYSQLQQVM